VADVVGPSERPTGSVTLRRARPDAMTAVVLFVVCAANAVLANNGAIASTWIRAVATAGAIVTGVRFVIWTIHRPTTRLDRTGITVGSTSVRWEFVVRIEVAHDRWSARVRVEDVFGDKVWLPAPSLLGGDTGRPAEEFDAGVAEVRRWLSAYAPQARMPAPGQSLIDRALSSRAVVGGFVAVGAVMTVLAWLIRR
jgi:hypothetical protein